MKEECVGFRKMNLFTREVRVCYRYGDVSPKRLMAQEV